MTLDRTRVAYAMLMTVIAGTVWVAACSGGADTGVSCLRLTCPAGFEADQAACTCKPLGASTSEAGTCTGAGCDAGSTVTPPGAAACTDGKGFNPKTNACEASPGGGAVRADLVNKEMSLGIHNDGDGPPQGIREAHLEFNWGTTATNSIVAVAVPPSSITIDGKTTNDAEWRGVPSVTLSGMARATALMPVSRRTNGTATNITSEDFGVSEITVAAAYDGSSIYFRLEWSDSSQNDARGRWIYNGTKWVRDTATTQPLPDGNLAAARAVTQSEDKVALLFNVNIPDFFGDNGGFGAGCAGLCHLEGKDGQRVAVATTNDAGTTFLGGGGLMHTNGAGHKVDVWQWKATRTNNLRIFDDQVIDETSRHGDALQNDDFPYTGGTCTRKNSDGARYPSTDSSTTVEYFSNEFFDDVGAGCPSLGPSRLPFPYTPGVKAMFEDGSPLIGKNGGTASKPIDGSVTPAVNDTIPGYVWRTSASTSACLRCQNEAEGHWSPGAGGGPGDGRWVVEMRRALVAPDADDVDFTLNQSGQH